MSSSPQHCRATLSPRPAVGASLLPAFPFSTTDGAWAEAVGYVTAPTKLVPAGTTQPAATLVSFPIMAPAYSRPDKQSSTMIRAGRATCAWQYKRQAGTCLDSAASIEACVPKVNTRLNNNRPYDALRICAKQDNSKSGIRHQDVSSPMACLYIANLTKHSSLPCPSSDWYVPLAATE